MNPRNWLFYSLFLFVVVQFSIGSVAMAQESATMKDAAATSPSPTPAAGTTPQPKATPLEGKAELTDVKFETRLQTYRAVDRAAAAIAEEVKKKTKDGDVIVFYDPRQIGSLDNFRVLRSDLLSQINTLGERYRQIQRSYCEIFECTAATPGVGLTGSIKPINLNTLVGPIFGGGGRTPGPAASRATSSLSEIKHELDNIKLLKAQIATQAAQGTDPAALSTTYERLDASLERLDLLVGGAGSETGNEDMDSLKKSISNIRESSESARGTVMLAATERGSKSTVTERGRPPVTRISVPDAVDMAAVNSAQATVDHMIGTTSTMLWPGLSTLTTTVGLATDMLAMFRTDTKITGVEVNVDKEALVAGLTSKLTERTVYHPVRFFPATNSGTITSDLMTKIKDVDTAKTDAESKVFAYRLVIAATIDNQTADRARLVKRIDGIDKYITDLEADRSKEKDFNKKKNIQDEIEKYQATKPAIEDKIRPIDQTLFILGLAKSHMDRLQDLNAEARQFIIGMSTATGGEESKFVTYLRAERLEKSLAAATNGKYYWLDVDVVGGGGNSRTRKNLIAYFSGAKVDFSGGAIVTWKLYDPTGNIISSGFDTRYNSYVGSKKLTN